MIAVAQAHVISANIGPLLMAGLTTLCLLAALEHGVRARSRATLARWSHRTGWWLYRAGSAPERMALEKWGPLPGLGLVLTWRRLDGHRYRSMVIPSRAGRAPCRRLRVWLRFDPGSVHG
ncbi:MAG: hypothetical protein PVG91_08940 [Gammaproteobacteria bacterium]